MENNHRMCYYLYDFFMVTSTSKLDFSFVTSHNRKNVTSYILGI